MNNEAAKTYIVCTRYGIMCYWVSQRWTPVSSNTTLIRYLRRFVFVYLNQSTVNLCILNLKVLYIKRLRIKPFNIYFLYDKRRKQ